MPIQIIDNFDLTTAKPIDNRIVVGPAPSFYLNKDDIPNKYQGMRIWELPGADLGSGVTNSTANGLAYVWTGTSWISENTTSISGSGTVGRVAYFSSANSIQSSNIYFANNNIGIGANAESTTGAKLFVSGDIKTSTKFVGPGTGITNINASNIDNGTLNVLRFGGNSNVGWILTSDNINSASYKNPNTLVVATSSATDQLKLVNRSGPGTPTSVHYFVFYDGTGFPATGFQNKTIYTNIINPLSIQPSTGNIGINLTSAAQQKLDVNGQIRIRGGWPGEGRFLVSSNSNGDAMWATQSDVAVPYGAIIMWGGAANAIPNNWKLCDGSSISPGTKLGAQLISQSYPFGQMLYPASSAGPRVPDLRERFVVGAGGANMTQAVQIGSTGYTVGLYGGLNSVELEKKHLAKHKHMLTDAIDGAVFSTSGTHSHTVYGKDESVGGSSRNAARISNSSDYNQTGTTSNNGGHKHTGNTGDGTTDGVGVGGFSGNGYPHENRPPYYALCFIIKIN